ncbi:hypothetical protein AGMMS50268_06330 [Spirochaetia bacterium]|nr:hypothetical protein AGMMS50268_06330 [Spirochaetia bacterium]
MRRFFKVLGEKFALAGFVGACFFVSCSTEEAIQQVLGSSSEAPVFLACKPVDAREIDFQFSLPVRVVSLNFEPPVAVESRSDGVVVKVILGETLNGGAPMAADLLVEDEAGNTLNVLVPFRARNDRLPKLLINELQDEYTKGTRIEFVELKTQSAGNLGALRLFVTSYTKNPLVFEFPPVEVGAGEYICVHLRTLDEGAVDETGTDLGLSAGINAAPEGRDFWVPGSVKSLHKTDVVYLLDQDDKVVDAVMTSESPDPWWSKEHFAAAADLLHKQGAWVAKGGGIPGPQDAIPSKSKTASRSVSRDESIPDTNRAGDWYITANSSATPGKPNSTKRFE